MKYSLLPVLSVLFALVAGACSTPYVKEGAAVGRVAREGEAPLNMITFTDSSLAKEGERGYSKVAVERTGGRPTATGSLEAWGVLRNRTDYPVQLEYQASFFDENGAPVEGPTAWQRLHLSPQETRSVSVFSTKPMSLARNYLIQIREGR